MANTPAGVQERRGHGSETGQRLCVLGSCGQSLLRLAARQGGGEGGEVVEWVVEGMGGW